METISIKPYFSTVIHSKDVVELRQGVWNSVSHMLRDDNQEGLLSDIILKLHSPISPNELAETLGVNRSKIESVLDYLNMLGVLQSKPESFIDQYMDRLAPALQRPQKTDYTFTTPVVFLGDVSINSKIHSMIQNASSVHAEEGGALWDVLQHSDEKWMFDAMEQEKFIQQFMHWKGKFIVLSLRHIDPIISSKLNRIARVLNLPWIHLALDGPFIFIGPSFDGKHGACYDCFEKRVGMNLRESECYQNYKKSLYLNQIHHSEHDPLFDVMSTILSAHAVLEIFNQVITQCGFTKQKILSIFLPTMEFGYHEFLKFPNCRTCGSVMHRDDSQLYFDFQQIQGAPSA